MWWFTNNTENRLPPSSHDSANDYINGLISIIEGSSGRARRSAWEVGSDYDLQETCMLCLWFRW
jgi:hypothetical protein